MDQKKSELRKSEVRSENPDSYREEIRSQKWEVRNEKSELRSQKWEVRIEKSEMRSKKWEVRKSEVWQSDVWRLKI